MQPAPALVVTEPQLHQSAQCEPILRSLPQWFGIEEAIVHYVDMIDHLPTLLALHTTDQHERAIGFLTIKQHFDYAAEIYVMGVLPDAHRMGVGRALVAAAEDYLRAHSVDYLQVKTLSPSRPNTDYAQTRAFYCAIGFRPLEEFPTLWGEHNPCLQLIKAL